MRKIILLCLCGISLLSLLASGLWFARDYDEAPDWLRIPIAAPAERGELVVLTLSSTTSTLDNPDGYEHDLATLFGTEIGVPVRFVELPSHAALLSVLARNRSHLAAADLVETTELRSQFEIGPHYKTIQYQLIATDNDKKISSLNEVEGEHIAVVAETPAHDVLRDLTGSHPGIMIDVLPALTDSDGLLKQVEDKLSRYALVSADSFALGKRLHPNLMAQLKVGKEVNVAWAYAPIADSALKESAKNFFAKVKKNGTLLRLHDRYYGYADRIAPVDSEALIEKIDTLLPSLEPYFLEAATLTGLDWRLLAAVAYQESHWNEKAESPTGVRGLMMLTEDTAERMEVNNLADPRESIIGGAKYLALLRNTVPERITEPDRTWMALAAYNQGYRHLEDARTLTNRMKLNADSWLDVRKTYPLLSNPQYYETLEYGYCRGEEAVALVEAIRNYYDILSKLAVRETMVKKVGMKPTITKK